MSRMLRKYLDQVIVYANRSEEKSEAIRKELEDHLLKKIADLEGEGQSHEDAVFEAIEEHGDPRTVGYGLRKHRWLDLRASGTARGLVAIGPRAVGTVAIGGMACGVFACGIVGVGIFSLSVFGAAFLWCFGAWFAFAPFGLAQGQIAIGFVAIGAWEYGVITMGRAGYALYSMSPGGISESIVFSAVPYGTVPSHVYWLAGLVLAYVHTLYSPVMFQMLLGGILSAGLAAIWRQRKMEKERIGFTVWRF